MTHDRTGRRPSSAVSGDTPPTAATPDVGDAAWHALPLIATLPVAVRDALRRELRPRAAAIGEQLFGQGETADTLALVTVGQVKGTVVTAGGRVVVVGRWDAPVALGKAAVLGAGRHAFTAETTQPCTWRALTRARFERLTDAHPELRRHALDVLARQATAAQSELVDMATLPVRARLARWLVTAAAGRGELAVDVTQDELAHRLGATRVTVNRALRQLEDEQLIHRAAGIISLRAPEALAACTGDQR